MDGATFMMFALDGGSDRPLAVPAGQSFGVEFSHDDRELAVAGTGYAVVIDTATGSVSSAIRSNTDTIVVHFAPDHATLFTGGIDHYLHVWDARTGAEITSLRTPGEIYGIVPNRDGSRIAIATDSAAVVWQLAPYSGDAATLRELAACRTSYEVFGGVLRQRAIDTATCNKR